MTSLPLTHHTDAASITVMISVITQTSFVSRIVVLISMTSPVIFVGGAGRGKAGGDLRPAVMRFSQRSSESDAGAGDMGATGVRGFERRRDCDRCPASA